MKNNNLNKMFIYNLNKKNNEINEINEIKEKKEEDNKNNNNIKIENNNLKLLENKCDELTKLYNEDLNNRLNNLELKNVIVQEFISKCSNLENINNETKRSYNTLCERILTSEHNINLLQHKNNDLTIKLNEMMEMIKNFKQCCCNDNKMVEEDKMNDNKMNDNKMVEEDKMNDD